MPLAEVEARFDVMLARLDLLIETKCVVPFCEHLDSLRKSLAGMLA